MYSRPGKSAHSARHAMPRHRPNFAIYYLFTRNEYQTSSTSQGAVKEDKHFCQIFVGNNLGNSYFSHCGFKTLEFLTHTVPFIFAISSAVTHKGRNQI